MSAVKYVCMPDKQNSKHSNNPYALLKVQAMVSSCSSCLWTTCLTWQNYIVEFLLPVRIVVLSYCYTFSYRSASALSNNQSSGTEIYKSWTFGHVTLQNTKWTNSCLLYQVVARMSIPKMYIPKMYIPITSNMAKCLFWPKYMYFWYYLLIFILTLKSS